MTSPTHPDRVAEALGIYRSIAACHARIARGNNDAHALTAALMLPCYEAGFRRLAGTLTPAEEATLGLAIRELRMDDQRVAAA